MNYELEKKETTLVIQQVSLRELERKYDEAERLDLPGFTYFNDIEVVQWFLYAPRHLHRENDRSERTVREYEMEITQCITHMMEYSEEIGLDVQSKDRSLWKSLDKRHLRRYQQWLAYDSPYVKENGSYAKATLERKTNILSSFFKFLYDIEYIERPIHEGFRTATVRKDDRPNRDLGPSDIRTLLQAFRSMNHPLMEAIILILTTTGMRNAEFCSLKTTDVYKDTIHNNYYLAITGKGNKRRDVPLRKETFEAIRTFRALRGLDFPTEEEGPLFPTSRGSYYSPSYFSQYMNKELKKLPSNILNNIPVKLTPHTFRHAFAIISHRSGVDVYDIMRSLGHERIDTTMIYLEKVFAKERHAIHSWDAFFNE